MSELQDTEVTAVLEKTLPSVKELKEAESRILNLKTGESFSGILIRGEGGVSNIVDKTGLSLTTSPIAASIYAAKKGARVTAVKVDFRNPLCVQCHSEAINLLRRGNNDKDMNRADEMYDFLHHLQEVEEMIAKRAKKSGFDAIVYQGGDPIYLEVIDLAPVRV